MELRTLPGAVARWLGKGTPTFFNGLSVDVLSSKPMSASLWPVPLTYISWRCQQNTILQLQLRGYYMKLCKPTMLGVRLTDPLSSSEYADSLQFDHHVNVLHHVPLAVRGAIPFWRAFRYGRREDCASGIPPPAADKFRAVDSYELVVVHSRRRKFLPVVRHRNPRMKVIFEYVVYSTGNTTHNIACDVLALVKIQPGTEKPNRRKYWMS